MKISSRNGCWLSLTAAALALAFGCQARNTTLTTPAPELNARATAQPEPDRVTSTPPTSPAVKPASDSSEPPLWLKSLRADYPHFTGRVFGGAGRTFLRSDNLTALLLAGGASAVMHNNGADDRIQDDVRHHRFFSDSSEEALNFLGHPGFHFASTGIWYALSAENRDDLNRQRALKMLTALSVTGAVTTGLKAVRDNDCPNGEPWAWPSGHTSSSFTVASVLDEFYGPKVGIPAYVLASLVAYRMLDTDDHWASDLVFGATLGWVVGHTIAGEDKKLEIAGFQIAPYVSGNGEQVTGISFFKRF